METRDQFKEHPRRPALGGTETVVQDLACGGTHLKEILQRSLIQPDPGAEETKTVADDGTSPHGLAHIQIAPVLLDHTADQFHMEVFSVPRAQRDLHRLSGVRLRRRQELIRHIMEDPAYVKQNILLLP